MGAVVKLAVSCDHENARGVRCSLGAGHRIACRFRRLVLSAGEDAALRDLVAKTTRAPIEVFGGGTNQQRALVAKGLAIRALIGMRFYKLWASAAGHRFAAENEPTT